MRFYLGCTEWKQIVLSQKHQILNKNNEYKQEFFYPITLDPTKYLSYYSQFFNFVEFDLDSISCYYNNTKLFSDTTKINLLEKWSKLMPANFRFSLVIPKQLILDNNNHYNYNKYYNDNNNLENFLLLPSQLKKKILVILLHIPSSLTLAKDREWLDSLLSKLCNHYEYSVAIDFDHHSWYQDLTYNILKKYNASLIWSDVRYRHSVSTSNFLYLTIDKNLERWIEKLKEKDRETTKYTIENALNKNKFSNNAISITRFAVISVKTNSLERINFVKMLLGLPSQNKIEVNQTKHQNFAYSNNNIRNKEWTGKAIFHVDINSFYSSCEEIRNSSLKGKPHAVIMTDQESDNITRGVVATCSYEAKRLGIQSAMPLFKALKLCPHLILNRVDKKYYEQISTNVMTVLKEYADTLEQASIDEAYLDCTNKILNLNMTVEQYAKKIKKTIYENCYGLLTSIGVSTTKSVAKIASDYKKPDGLTIISHTELKKFLYPLDVERISGIGIKTQTILKKEMNITTIGQLAKTDIQILTQRFGKRMGIWMWQIANGEDKSLVIQRGDHVSLSTESTLEISTLDKLKIRKLLNKLVDELYEKITRNGYQFRTVGIKLVRTDFSTETREKSYTTYQKDRKSIESIIDELLDRFILDHKPKNDDTKNIAVSDASNSKILYVRKVGLKVSTLIRREIKKNILSQQTTLLDYVD